MAERFLSTLSNEVITALTGISRDLFVRVYDKYCGAGTPIYK